MARARTGARNRGGPRRAACRRVGRRYDTKGRNALTTGTLGASQWQVTAPISPPPVRDYKPEYIPAYLSNGLIGLRVGRIPLVEGLAMVNGLAAVHPTDRVESFARAPYPLAGDIAIDRVKLSERMDLARFVEQRYDFSAGELTSRFAFDVNG